MRDLLLVLGMSEDEQSYWTAENTDRRVRGGSYESLADLAFRLRDEVLKEHSGCERYHEAIEDIYKYREIRKQGTSLYAWTAYQLKPIDMIIAALIAKQEPA